MSGSLRDYDDLCEALEAYEAAPFPAHGWQMRLGRVALYAHRCGKPGGEATLPWAKRRRETYRNTVTGAVAYLQEHIDALHQTQGAQQ